MLISKQICDGLEDYEIIFKVKEDVDYFACVYQRYGKRLLRYIRRISALSEQEAEDILQDAFIKVWKNINGFDTDLQLSSWLYRIIHNETVSHWRRDKWSKKITILELDEKHLEEIADDLGIPEQCCPDLRDKIQLIPEKYREVIILKYFEEMSYEEISDILRIPEGTVAIRINRAKQALKKILKNHKIMLYG